MKVNCEECGYQGEIDGRTWSPVLRCPKCHLNKLQRGGAEQIKTKAGRVVILVCGECGYQKEINKKDFKRTVCPRCSQRYLHIDEEKDGIKEKVKSGISRGKTFTDPVKEIGVRDGRKAIRELVKQGKTLDEAFKIMQGRLAVSTIRGYYGYAKMDERRAAESPMQLPANHIPTSQITEKQVGQFRIIKIDVFEEFVDGLKKNLEQALQTEATAGAFIAVSQILGMLQMLKKEIYES